MITRVLEESIRNKLGQDKAIVIMGARQVGKTTLLKHLFKEKEGILWLNGDEQDTRALFENISATRLKYIFGNNKTVIIDEAQDLDDEYFDKISRFNISYGADDAQILYPEHSSNRAELQSRFPENVEYVLDKNFRSTLAIMNFAKVAFPNAYIPQNTLDTLADNPGEKPTLVVTDGNPTFDTGARNTRNDAIRRIIETFRADTHNIAILVPFKKTVEQFHEILSDLEIAHSIYYEDQSVFPNGCPPIDNVHITTYKSAKGLEFDTVLIPDFGSMNYLCSKFEVLNWKDFYVAVTRARTNLYLFSNFPIPSLSNVTE